jgi:hypothetical protein
MLESIFAAEPARSTAAARRPRFRGTALLAVAGALLLASGLSPAAAVQLSDGHPFSDVDVSATLPQISPNGLRVVYRQDAVVDGAGELWSVTLAGGTPVRLSDVLNTNQNVSSFAISPNSARVVYTVDQDTTGKVEIYSVPIGGGVSVKLNPTLTSGGNVINFHISPDSTRVVYVADRTTNQWYEMFSVPITGGTSDRLDAGPNSGYDVDTYAISPNSDRVVYRLVVTALGLAELWSVPLDGPAEEGVKISRILPTGAAVDPYFQISPSSARVVYTCDALSDGRLDIYSVSIFGGSSTQLNTGGPASATTDSTYLISSNSQNVVFRASSTSTSVSQLWSVPILGGTPTRLNTALQAGENVEAGFRISPNGNTVVYLSDEADNDVVEAWSVPVGGGTPTRLNGPLASGNSDVIELAISPDGARVVYRADQNVDTLNELFSVPIGGGSATKLNRTLATGGDVQNFRITANSQFVIYGADQDVDETFELMAAPLAGGTVVDISGPLVAGGDVALCSPTCLAVPSSAIFQLAANGVDIVYVADEDVNDEFELYASLLGGPPGAPTAVAAAPGNTQVTVTFAAPASNGGSTITEYTITPSPATVGWVDNNAGTASLTHVISNLVNGTAYTFTVRATNANGIGDASAPSNVAIPATVPTAPTAVGAIARNFSADVTFTAPTSDGGSPITGYTVISNPAGGIDITQGTPALKHYMVGLTNGVSYTFTVVAQNLIGPSPASLASPAVTPGCIPGGIFVFCDGMESGDSSLWSFTAGPPGAPTGASATGGDAQASVSFSAPVENGGSPITGYTVTSIPAGGLDSDAGSTSLVHLVTGLTNGVSYTFTVRATNANGDSPPSLPSNSVIPATVPGPPTSVAAVAGNTTAAVAFLGPVNNGGSPILGYTVTSSPAGGVDTNAGQLALAHAITGLTNGVEYTFSVTATNAVGTSSPSKSSNPVIPTP